MRCLALFLALILTGCAVTPRHTIPVHSDYIAAGVEAGDKVEIVTVDGRELAIVVATVDADTIVGDDGTAVAFTDIATLAKRSWTEPRHPCGDGLPLECSVPDPVAAIDERFRTRFHDACVQHDFCYRHGHATYGVSRAECDDRFRDDMQAKCNEGKLFGVIRLGDDPLDDVECLAMAASMYRAVRRYGAAGFRTVTSTVCPYDLE